MKQYNKIKLDIHSLIKTNAVFIMQSCSVNIFAFSLSFVICYIICYFYIILQACCCYILEILATLLHEIKGFNMPIGVTVNKLTEDIIACDTRNNVVKIYDWHGSLKTNIEEVGKALKIY